MVSELSSVNKVVGAKQVRRALNDGRACKVFLACDADPALTEPLLALCRETLRIPMSSHCESLNAAAAAAVLLWEAYRAEEGN